MGFLITQGDDIFVGKYLGLEILGLYIVAYKISNLPTTEITNVVSQVTFPAFAKVQGNIPRLRAAYLKVLLFTAFLSFPITILVFTLAHDFTVLFLKEEWLPMVPALQVLAFFGLMRALASTRIPLFNSVGKPYITARVQAVRLLVLAGLIYPFTRAWGIAGTGVSLIVSGLIFQPIEIYFSLKIVKCRLRDLAQQIILPLLAALVMIAIMFGFKLFVFTHIGFINFFLLVVLGLAAYFGTIYIIESRTQFKIISLMREQLNAMGLVRNKTPKT